MATKIPSIPSPIKPDPVLSAIKEIIEVREGLRGEYVDRLVSVRELKELIVENDEIVGLLASGHAHDPIELTERSSDPEDPEEGHCKIWQSDGTGTGDDGDLMAKIRAAGVVKTITIIDFSAA